MNNYKNDALEENTAFGILTEDLEYIKKGQKIVVPKDTPILVDTKENIALIHGDHVTIDSKEYKIA